MTPILDFVPLRASDLPLLHQWQNEPLVRQWYARGPRSLEDVTQRYLPTITGKEPTRCFVLRVAGEPAGFWKTYRIGDYPAYAAGIEAEDGWAGMDFLIGEAGCRGRGLAAAAHAVFLENEVFADAATRACVSGPNPENERSVRSLERAGFRRLRTVEVDGDVELLMIRRRAGAEGT